MQPQRPCVFYNVAFVYSSVDVGDSRPVSPPHLMKALANILKLCFVKHLTKVHTHDDGVKLMSSIIEGRPQYCAKKITLVCLWWPSTWLGLV